MKRLTTMCVATVFSCAVAAMAQTQQAGEPQQTQTQRPDAATSDQTGQRQATAPAQAQGRAATSMFIGCVEKGSTPNAFVLSVTEMPGSPAASGTTATGQAQARPGQGNTQATGTTGTPTVGHRMELIGGTNVAAHVGHKVEITGMVVPQGNATGRTTQTAAADMRVNVSNLRMIDANCVAPTGTRGTSGTATSEPTPAPGSQKTQPDPKPEAQPAPEGRPY